MVVLITPPVDVPVTVIGYVPGGVVGEVVTFIVVVQFGVQDVGLNETEVFSGRSDAEKEISSG